MRMMTDQEILNRAAGVRVRRGARWLDERWERVDIDTLLLESGLPVHLRAGVREARQGCGRWQRAHLRHAYPHGTGQWLAQSHGRLKAAEASVQQVRGPVRHPDRSGDPDPHDVAAALEAWETASVRADEVAKTSGSGEGHVAKSRALSDNLYVGWHSLERQWKALIAIRQQAAKDIMELVGVVA